MAVQMRGLGEKVTGQLDIWYLIQNHCLNRYKYYEFGLNSYRKMNILRFSPYKCIRIKFDLAIKVGQGQPRFIICANLVGPTSPMLQA